VQWLTSASQPIAKLSSMQHEYIALLDERLTAANRSYEESINRYRNGLIEYTTVLLQLNTLQTLERDRVAAQFNLLQYRINLYRALGGTWPNELEEPSRDHVGAERDSLWQNKKYGISKKEGAHHA